MTHWVRRVRRLSENFNKTFDAGGELTFSIKCRQHPKYKKKWKHQNAGSSFVRGMGMGSGEKFYIPESFVV